MKKEEILGMVGKRLIVVAKEKLEELSASFVENRYSGISGYSGYGGITGYSGTSGISGSSGKAGFTQADDRFALKLRKIPLIVFNDYWVREVTDDCTFIRVAQLSGGYGISYGTWYTCENFFDAFDVLKILDYGGSEK